MVSNTSSIRDASFTTTPARTVSMLCIGRGRFFNAWSSGSPSLLRMRAMVFTGAGLTETLFPNLARARLREKTKDASRATEMSQMTYLGGEARRVSEE